jgi:dihydroorotate dehydrogenase
MVLDDGGRPGYRETRWVNSPTGANLSDAPPEVEPMPDWFYRTVSRPMLFRLSAERARGFALGFMAALGRLPLGPRVIDFLGHMRADPRLARTFLGVRFPAPVGIGPGLDARAVALPALARFGVGFLEVGPVTLAGGAGAAPLLRRADQQAIWRPEPAASLAVDEALARLHEARGTVPLIVHLASSAAAPDQAAVEYNHVAAKLATAADVLVLRRLPAAVAGDWSIETWQEHLRGVLVSIAGCPRPLLVAVEADLDAAAVDRYLGAVEAGISGVVVEGSIRAEPAGRIYGLPALALALEQTRRIRQRWPELVILAGGGVHEPEHALEMQQAGANLVSTDTGLIYTGPGLPKRINDAVLYAEHRDEAPEPQPPFTERVWFWTTLMSVGLLIGSVLALLIAATQVVLPYDLTFVHMTRAELAGINPRLLLFLAHDRVSLAGAMIALGVMYLGLSLWGVRRGLHWAQQSVLISAFAGFATFFLFLGYGYLDPFHAFATAIMFQFLMLALHSRLGPAPLPDVPQLHGDWRWRQSLWGQLILVGHAVAVVVAGLVISCFGITRVFVPEDLAFLRTTAEQLQAANPHLLSLIAHDRATFGGQLVAVGLVLLLPALWGFRPLSGWLWWTQLVAVVLAYTAAIAVHLVVGYTDLWHLTPAYGGLAVFLLGQALSYPFLCRPGATPQEWRRFLRR